MLLNRLFLSCVMHRGLAWYSGLAVPFLFPCFSAEMVRARRRCKVRRSNL